MGAAFGDRDEAGLRIRGLLASGRARPPEVLRIGRGHDGRDPILIASKYGGVKHPQWYYNLIAHSECRLGGGTFVAAEITDSDEYARLFALAERVYAGYDYRAKRAAIARQIPAFRLKPR